MNLRISEACSIDFLSQNEIILFPNQDRLNDTYRRFALIKDSSKNHYSLENIDLSIYISGYFDL